MDGLEYASDDHIVLWGEQHRQHVVDWRKVESPVVLIEHRKVAEMAIGIGDQTTKGMDKTHHLHRRRIDAPIPVKPYPCCNPVVDHPVLSGIDRHERCNAHTTVQSLSIKAIQLEKRHSFKGMDFRARSTDPAVTEYRVREMFGDEQIRPALSHCGAHWR